MNNNTNKIEKLGDGAYKVSISFDITNHGHNYGLPRNYNLAKVQKLIRSKSVQEAIKNGYAICMYGHKARNKKQGYLASEANEETGNLQEPIGKVTKMSVRDKIISYEMILVETLENKAKSVVKLIEHNIGGFSAVWDVASGVLYGMDYVLSPNFNGNKVVMDSICTDGECKLDTAIHDTVLDAIGTHEDLYDVAKDLLVHQDNVSQAIEFKSKVLVMQDNVLNLQEEIEENKILLDNQKITIKGQSEDIKQLENEKEIAKKEHLSKKDETGKIAIEIEELKKEKDELKVLKDSLEENGLVIKDGAVILDSMALGELLTPSSKDKYAFDEDTLEGLRKPNKASATDNIVFKY